MRCTAIIALLLIAAIARVGASQAPVPPVVPPHSHPAAAPATAPLDINTATIDQLRALPGFGIVYARRVIDGRPYTSRNQLLTRGVIPPAAYARVSSLIVAHRSHR
ncbi:MAG: helix-hairpin-helix domain-containing protein [Acidobacteria bacterium]|nr:helix-hairpin-helix domain-containing protein [Acidobacteriota bacterium]